MSENETPSEVAPNTSGQGVNAQIPDEIKKWNWGAFLMSWIWGIGNSTWIALLALLPGANLAVAIILGIKGNEWAWRNKKWPSVEEFKRVQRIWAWVGLGLVIVILIVVTIAIVFGLVAAIEGTNSSFDSDFDDFDSGF